MAEKKIKTIEEILTEGNISYSTPVTNILEEVKERRYYTKPSVKRRMKKLEKKRLIKRAAEKEKAKYADEYKKR